MHKGYLRIAFVLGAVTVGLGAFGAHKLKQIVNADAVAIYQTGILYQFIHVFALALTSIIYASFPTKTTRLAGIFFLAGIVLFSGSLYLLTYGTATSSTAFKWEGPVTPVGGLSFIIGWLCLAFAVSKRQPR